MLSSINVHGRPIQDRWYQERYSHITCSLSPKKKGGRRASRVGNVRTEYSKEAVKNRDLLLEIQLQLSDPNQSDVEVIMSDMAGGRELSEQEVEHVKLRYEEHELSEALGLWYTLEHPETLYTNNVTHIVDVAIKHYPSKLTQTNIKSLMKVLNDNEPPTLEEVSYIIRRLEAKGFKEPFPKTDLLPLIYSWYVSCALHEEQTRTAHCCLDDECVVL